jgi:excisionase family DNA binding protein
MEDEEWLSEAEVMQHLGISRQTCYNLRQANVLPFYKLNGRNRYKKADIDAYVIQRTTPQLQNHVVERKQAQVALQQQPDPEPLYESSPDDFFI